MTRKNKIAHWIACRLPNRVVYWCIARGIYHSTSGEYRNEIVPEVTAMEVFKRWGDDKAIVD